MMQPVLKPLVKGVLRRAARYTRSKPLGMRNQAPLVTFTFDDVPDSAYVNGAAVLERHGLRGTFYVASGTCGHKDAYWRVIGADQVRALYDAGHEIGCHTFSHVRVEDLDAQRMDEECAQNLRRLRELCPGIALTNFCYPFGRASLPRKMQLQKRFDSCRGVYQGVNASTADLGMLRTIDLYDRTLTPDKLRRVLRETRERNGWLIFTTHDVADKPSWIGCSPRLLADTIAAVQAENMQCLPIRDALKAIGYIRAM
ncbi:MAG TPA: polysaccharide deacetylase family protein [Xanthobacteraceae bacterium]|jgi:peptidoglycan/xylan/chitin deacetylase (PgdA/CDA1 family)|nr:polysaccharide deacetylase family protein [Xanthobacteraceae bacterium]